MQALYSYIPNINSFTAAAQGTLYGGNIAFGNLHERTVRAGANPALTSIFQIPSVLGALSLGRLAVETAIKGPIPLGCTIGIQCVGLLLPVVTAAALNVKVIDTLAKKKFGEDHWVSRATDSCANVLGSEDAQRAIYFIHNNLGRIAQVAGIVASVALIALGNPIAGGVTLVFIGADLLCEYGILPSRVRILFASALPYTNAAMSLLVGNVLEKAITITTVALEILGLAYEWYERLRRAENHAPQLNFQELHDLGSHLCMDSTFGAHGATRPIMTEGSVNRTHVDAALLLSPEPTLDLRVSLKAMNDAVDWNNETVRKRINRLLIGNGQVNSGDQLWQKYLSDRKRVVGNADSPQQPLHIVENTDDSRVAYIKWGIYELGRKIVDEQILEGEPKSYDTIRTIVKQNAEVMLKMAPEERLGYLLNMGLAGHYCGAGMLNIAQEDHSSLCGVEELTFEGQITALLAQKRRQLANGVYKFVTELSPVVQLLDANDVHLANSINSQLFPTLGLQQNLAAQDDNTLANSSITRLMRRGIAAGIGIIQERVDSDSPIVNAILEGVQMGINVEEMVWAEYTPDVIIREVRDGIREGQISSSQVGVWWQGWIKRNLLASDPKAQAVQTDIDAATTALERARHAGLEVTETQKDLDAAIKKLNVMINDKFYELTDADETPVLFHVGNDIPDTGADGYYDEGKRVWIYPPRCKKGEYTDAALMVMLSEMGILNPPRAQESP